MNVDRLDAFACQDRLESLKRLLDAAAQQSSPAAVVLQRALEVVDDGQQAFQQRYTDAPTRAMDSSRSIRFL